MRLENIRITLKTIKKRWEPIGKNGFCDRWLDDALCNAESNNNDFKCPIHGLNSCSSPDSTNASILAQAPHDINSLLKIIAILID